MSTSPKYRTYSTCEKVIKIHQDFPELRSQMYCHLFMVHSVEPTFASHAKSDNHL